MLPKPRNRIPKAKNPPKHDCLRIRGYFPGCVCMRNVPRIGCALSPRGRWRLGRRGGNYNNTSNAGLGYLNGNNVRSNANANYGCRPRSRKCDFSPYCWKGQEPPAFFLFREGCVSLRRKPENNNPAGTRKTAGIAMEMLDSSGAGGWKQAANGTHQSNRQRKRHTWHSLLSIA